MKKTKLGLALSALIGGLAVNGQAVTLTPDGLGDAAMFQYYAVNNGWQTIFRVINTSDQAVAVKVRFRGAANTRDVLDFIVFLSPHDMWDAWTDPDALKDGSNIPGLRTKDTSCIYPPVDSTAGDGWQTIDANKNLIGAKFKSSTFTGDYADGSALSELQRMSEGHVEFIGIASFNPGSANNLESNLANQVTHSANGKPQNCQAAASTFEQMLGAVPESGQDVGNVLGFNAYLINLDQGLGGGYDPTVLYDFFTADPVNGNNSLVYEALQSQTTPDLDSATPGPYGVPTIVNPNPTISQATQAFNQERRDGATIGQLLSVSADLNGDNDTLDTWNIDFDGDNQCQGIELNVVEANITLDQWAALDNGNARLTDSPAAGCNFKVTTSTAPGTWPIGNITNNYGPGRFKQLGQMGVWPVTGGVDAVSALLMRSDVINEWFAKENPGGAVNEQYTQWVLTFPTKYYYVDIMDDPNPFDDFSPMLPEVSADNDAWAPFSEEFDEGTNPGMSCEPFVMDLYNREERFARFTSPSPIFPNALCHEVNVLVFNQAFTQRGLMSNFAATIQSDALPTDADGSISTQGWAKLQFVGAGTREPALVNGQPNPRIGTLAEGLGHEPGLLGASDFGSQTTFWNTMGDNHGHLGLPVNGFMLTVFGTNSATTNHAVISSHKYNRNYQ